MNNTFISRLSSEQLDVLESIRTRNKLRFGDDIFRMQDSDGESDDDAGAEDDAGDPPNSDVTAKATEKLDLAKLPTEVQEIVKRYRKEAAEANGKAREEARTKAAEAATAEVTKKIAEALGLTQKETKDLTPEQLQKKLEESTTAASAAREAAKQKDIELAVYRSANKVGGDPDALLDSRSFLAKLRELDPSKEEFNDKVAAAIKDAVKENAKLKLQASAGVSSADHGAGGDTGTKQVKSLTDAVSGHYGT
jgi:transketolase